MSGIMLLVTFLNQPLKAVLLNLIHWSIILDSARKNYLDLIGNIFDQNVLTIANTDLD